ncbi:hypothetical protein [Salisaeta longa]|uniref:hypothetical protein n=1 Tax=Salisaeta longa TaxID=503170 RepID=UPI0003B3AF22|nr:hypothetical protein [Salisaeta longa]
MTRRYCWSLLLLILCVAPATVRAQTVYDTTRVNGTPAVIVTEAAGAGISPKGSSASSVTWTSDYTWILDGHVFVNEGQLLMIEPGTVVKGRPATDTRPPSALIVAQGGQIFARGTAEQPIIFTTTKDDLTTTDDLPSTFRGGWGGVVLLGRAPLNTYPNVLNVELLSVGEPRSVYGGQNPDDSSGILRYVSIRYGGTSSGNPNESTTPEYNGLTLAGVGQGTTIEYVETYKSRDDGVEWFGGTVDVRYLVSAFAEDDALDMDQGYRGRGQFWLVLQGSVSADRAAEMDGGDASFGGEDRKPYATPIIFNATLIGSGLDGAGGTALFFRDNFAGSLYNSIVASFPETVVRIEDVPTTRSGDSWARFRQGTIRIAGNLFHEAGGAFSAGTGSAMRGLVGNQGTLGDSLAAYLQRNNTVATQPPYQNLSRNSYGQLTSLNLRATGPATSLPGIEEPSGFFRDVNYVGAFGSKDWAAGWTFIGTGGTAYPGLQLLE